MKRGIFITLEGPEGSGKSTQARLLARALEDRGYEVVLSREPGGTVVGEVIRDVLLRRDSRIAPITELLLYGAARSQNVRDIIVPALKQGNIVICDRFMDSSSAYQGYGRQLGLEKVEAMHALALEGIKPHKTFLLDLDPEVGLSRVRGQELDRLEQEDLSFHQRVRQGYLEVCRRENNRFIVVPGAGKVEAIHEIILSAVLDLLQEIQVNNRGYEYETGGSCCE